MLPVLPHPVRRIAALTSLLALALTFGCAKQSTTAGVSADDMTQGSAAAPITIIEYASVTCPHCAEFNETVLPRLQAKYIATGKVRYVYREFLTPPENVSAMGILVARCAGKSRYFQVVDAIMRAQPEMFADDSTKNALPVLKRIGTTAGGLTAEQFDKCVTDPKGLQRLQTNVAGYVKDHNITGTPTFFINGKALHRTKGDISDFDRVLVPMLAGK